MPLLLPAGPEGAAPRPEQGRPLSEASDADLPPGEGRPKTETFGMSVRFLSQPRVAADAARREGKLLFVLHVSGNFEESCFT
jgi:hypothetical protein